MSNKLGDKIKKCRLKLGLTQVKLGLLLDVSNNTIARWERGELFPMHKKMLFLALKFLEIKKK